MSEKHGTDGIEATLAERAQQHGPFFKHCDIERQLRSIMGIYNTGLTNVQYIGLGMILHKIARILNNGQNHKDSWHDIAGYAILVEKSIDEQVGS